MLPIMAQPDKRLMSIAIKNRLWVAVFLFSSLLALAQPSSQMTFSFDRTATPVWDLSGSYHLDQPMLGAGGAPSPLVYDIDIHQDAVGRLHGSGTTLVTIGTDTVAAYYTVGGGVTGTGKSARANFTVHLRGHDWIAGKFRSFSIGARYQGVIDSGNLVLAGNASGSVSVSGSGHSNIRTPVSIALPPGADGAWTVTMNMLAMNQLSGTAIIAVDSYTSPNNPAGFPTQRVLECKLVGSYNPASGIASVRLDGIYDARGTVLGLKFNYENGQIVRMNGRVLGLAVQQ